MEIYENLTERGIRTTLIEAKAGLLPMFDRDMGIWIEDYMQNKAYPYLLGETVTGITENHVLTASGKTAAADVVVIAAGVKPEISLAESAKSSGRTRTRRRNCP